MNTNQLMSIFNKGEEFLFSLFKKENKNDDLSNQQQSYFEQENIKKMIDQNLLNIDFLKKTFDSINFLNGFFLNEIEFNQKVNNFAINQYLLQEEKKEKEKNDYITSIKEIEKINHEKIELVKKYEISIDNFYISITNCSIIIEDEKKNLIEFKNQRNKYMEKHNKIFMYSLKNYKELVEKHPNNTDLQELYSYINDGNDTLTKNQTKEYQAFFELVTVEEKKIDLATKKIHKLECEIKEGKEHIENLKLKVQQINEENNNLYKTIKELKIKITQLNKEITHDFQNMKIKQEKINENLIEDIKKYMYKLSKYIYVIIEYVKKIELSKSENNSISKKFEEFRKTLNSLLKEYLIDKIDFNEISKIMNINNDFKNFFSDLKENLDLKEKNLQNNITEKFEIKSGSLFKSNLIQEHEANLIDFKNNFSHLLCIETNDFDILFIKAQETFEEWKTNEKIKKNKNIKMHFFKNNKNTYCLIILRKDEHELDKYIINLSEIKLFKVSKHFFNTILISEYEKCHIDELKNLKKFQKLKKEVLLNKDFYELENEHDKELKRKIHIVKKINYFYDVFNKKMEVELENISNNEQVLKVKIEEIFYCINEKILNNLKKSINNDLKNEIQEEEQKKYFEPNKHILNRAWTLIKSLEILVNPNKISKNETLMEITSESNNNFEQNSKPIFLNDATFNNEQDVNVLLSTDHLQENDGMNDYLEASVKITSTGILFKNS